MTNWFSEWQSPRAGEVEGSARIPAIHLLSGVIVDFWLAVGQLTPAPRIEDEAHRGDGALTLPGADGVLPPRINSAIG